MKMKLILKKVHVYLYIVSVAFIYFLLWPLTYCFSRSPARYKNMNRLRRLWGFISSALVGFFYQFEYEQAIDWNKPYIVCPNHTSNLDISAMSVMVKNNCSFMGKEELKNGLVTGLFFRTVDIPVNRESKMSSFRAFKIAGEKLQAGITLIIFPEGGIANDYPPVLQQFKNGPFKLAIAFKIPIIPVSSANSWKMLWDDGKKYGTKPGVCNYFVHKPIETAHFLPGDADKLREQVHGILSRKLKNGSVETENVTTSSNYEKQIN